VFLYVILTAVVITIVAIGCGYFYSSDGDRKGPPDMS
jgi:hypothetical protein